MNAEDIAKHTETCRRCGASIIRAIYRDNVPLQVNAEPEPFVGNIALRLDAKGVPVAEMQTPGQTTLTGDLLHTSHFAVCPNPDGAVRA